MEPDVCYTIHAVRIGSIPILRLNFCSRGIHAFALRGARARGSVRCGARDTYDDPGPGGCAVPVRELRRARTGHSRRPVDSRKPVSVPQLAPHRGPLTRCPPPLGPAVHSKGSEPLMRPQALIGIVLVVLGA